MAYRLYTTVYEKLEETFLGRMNICIEMIYQVQEVTHTGHTFHAATFA